MSLSRREFLRTAALSSGAWASGLWLPGTSAVWARTRGSVVDASGTTLERTIRAVGEGPYQRLAYGPGWPIQVRAELAEPKRGREGRRVALVSFLHLTDFQLVDAQSPARVEFLDRTADEPTTAIPVEAAQRPQEAVVAHNVEAVVRQGNAVGIGPVTGRPLDFTICTGDNIDNRQANELDWFFALMNGGRFTPNSGAPDVFEGVQSFDEPQYYDPHYWHPEPVDDPLGRSPDEYRHFYGFPDYPGLLAAAIRPIDAVGLDTPWYSCLGNHDILVQGNEHPNPAYEAIATGGTKVLAPPPGWAPGDFYQALVTGDPHALQSFHLAPARPVTADPDRRFFASAEYIQAHLDSPGEPRGHGFTEDNLDPLTFYYAFQLVEGVDGLVLDTNSPRTSYGSIDEPQLQWLEQQLIARSSRYYDGQNEVRTGNDDRLVVIFSHHRADSMQPIQGPDHTGDVHRRYAGDELEALLHRFPNVIAWVNGHSHFNRVGPRPDPSGRTAGYWDITTSAQIDPPQQARILEVVDNRDGTLSIFTTIIDHAAPPQTRVGDYDLLGLAAISREVAFNDYQTAADAATGVLTDLNVELLLPAPFRLDVTPAERPAEEAAGRPGSGIDLPTTGGGVGAAAIGAAVAGAIALRNRRPPQP